MAGLVVDSEHAGRRCEHGRKSHELAGGTQDMLPHSHSSLLSQHSSGGCGGEPRGVPTTPRTGRDRAGLVAVLGKGTLCRDGAQQPSETLVVLSPLLFPSRGLSEDVSHLPGTAGHDPTAVTPGKAPGTWHCGWDGLESRAPLLSPVSVPGRAVGALLLLGHRISSHTW